MMLLDSNIIIYAAEPGYDAVREFIAQHDLAASVISKVEVLGYHKLSSENRNKLAKLFHNLRIIPISSEIVDQAISLRQKRKMSLGDALIAATALTHQMTIATSNIKDFSWIEELDVVDPVSD